jgi:hypothetical protein
MTAAASRMIALLAVVTALGMAFTAPPARAASPTGVICSLGGFVSGAISKACSLASHAGNVLSAGKKLLGGHVGGALEALGGQTAKRAASVLAFTALAAAVVAGAKSLLDQTASVIGATTRPNLTSTWFSAFYWRMAAVSALLTLPFLFAAAIQAMMRSDLSMLARAAFGYLPLAMLAVGVAAPVTMLLLAGSDEMSSLVASASGHAGSDFLARIGVISIASIATGNVFVGFLIGLLTAVATLSLWIELVIREAAVYVIVLMLPLFFAAMVWPARRIWAARAVELLVALILSKFAIVAVLALGGAALGHSTFPGLAASLTGATLVFLAACSPWALMRLLPLHEIAAAAAGGLRPAVGNSARSAAQTAEVGADLADRTVDLRRRLARMSEASPDAAEDSLPDAPRSSDETASEPDSADEDQTAAVAAGNGVREDPRGPLPYVFRHSNNWRQFRLGADDVGSERPLIDDDPTTPPELRDASELPDAPAPPAPPEDES